MTVWQQPAGTGGSPLLIRTTLPLLRHDPRECARGVALHARPLVKQSPDRSRRRPIENFSLAPVMAALDAIEHDDVGVAEALERMGRTRNCHPSHLSWAADAVLHYLAARSADSAAGQVAGRPPTYPVRESWVTSSDLAAPDRRGASRYERTAWGRRYASADGSLRELYLLSVNSVKPRGEAEIAEAAAVVATGRAATVRFGDIYRPVASQSAQPQHVRLVAVGCGDGSHSILVDSDINEVKRRYEEQARPALTRALEADDLTPGSSCVDCEGLMGCSGLSRVPALLGEATPRPERRRRSLSVSDLRTYASCPAKYHLTRVLHLKSTQPESRAVRRGRAVDAWLNEQHLTRRPHGCRGVPLPDELPGLASDELPAALRMIAEHAAFCPLAGLADGEQVQVQPRVAAYDLDLDTVVIADPDLLHTEGGGWVWRETKTASKRPGEARSLLAAYPQLALAVLLISGGVLGGDVHRSRIELEILYEDGAACEEIFPADRATIEDARRVIAEMTAPWATDTTYAATVGRACAGCEALPWCRPGLDHTSEGGR